MNIAVWGRDSSTTGGPTWTELPMPTSDCPVFAVDLWRYPSWFRFPRPHPLKLVLEAHGISVEDLHAALAGWADRPALRDLEAMLKGDSWLPFPVETKLWRLLLDFGVI